MQTEDKNPIQVADRLFLTMEKLAANGPMGLVELANEMDLHKSTMHRILNSLIYMGYVRQNPETQRYSMSLRLVQMANQILDRMDVLEEVRPYLRDIVKRTGETVHMVQRDGTDAVYLMKMESDYNHMRMVSKIGSRIPLYCSGVGKALAAEYSEEERRKLWEESDIRSWTPSTIVNYEQFEQEIAKIRQKGYAVDREENELGVRCVAVSLPDHRGRFKYAVSITGPTNRMDEDTICRYAEILQELRLEAAQIIH